MTTETDHATTTRVPLSRERVLQAGVDFADASGIEALSMRKLGQDLGVEAMSLYNHVKNKEDLLDGMVDVILGEIDTATEGTDWQTALRARILSARQALLRHPWAANTIESRVKMSPTMLKYMDDLAGIFLNGGFSVDLLHHAMHTLGSRMLGFTQELFDDSDAMEEDPTVAVIMMQQMAAEYPNITAIVQQVAHDDESVVGSGCDDEVEFQFALDLILDGLERLRTAE